MFECFCVSLTGCHGLRAAVVVVVVVIHTEEWWHVRSGAQSLRLVGGCWVVGVHVVLRGNVVAGQTAITVRHLCHARKQRNQNNDFMYCIDSGQTTKFPKISTNTDQAKHYLCRAPLCL